VTVGVVTAVTPVVDTPVVTGGDVLTGAVVVAVVPPHPLVAAAANTTNHVHTSIRDILADMNRSSPDAPGANGTHSHYPLGFRLKPLFALSHGPRALLSVAQPGLGAILAAGGSPGGRTLMLGFVAATAGMLSVYATNDLLDVEVDRQAAGLAPPRVPKGVAISSSTYHPLAHDLLSSGPATAWVVALGLVALASAWALRPGCALIFLACIALEVLYCSLKHRTWLKTIPAGVMVGMGGVAGWYAVRDLDRGAAALFVLLVMWEIFGRNLANDLADLSTDAPLGIQTLATTHGPRWSARACFGGAVAIVPVAALQAAPLQARVLLAVAALLFLTYPALALVRRPDQESAQRYFDRATLFPPAAFLATAAVFILWAGL
jgi:4-hydroxybenzoate polyprenyltransferase